MHLTGWDDLLAVIDEDAFKGADKDDCAAFTTLFAEAYFTMVSDDTQIRAPSRGDLRRHL